MAESGTDFYFGLYTKMEPVFLFSQSAEALLSAITTVSLGLKAWLRLIAN